MVRSDTDGADGDDGAVAPVRHDGHGAPDAPRPLDLPPLSDAELTRLALAAEPMAQPADDAVPLGTYLRLDSGLLPAWYMPTPMARVSPRWRLAVVLALVGAFLAIEAFGLCSTFGQVVPA